MSGSPDSSYCFSKSWHFSSPPPLSNTNTSMICVILNIPSAAESRTVRELSGNFTLSGEWSPWEGHLFAIEYLYQVWSTSINSTHQPVRNLSCRQTHRQTHRAITISALKEARRWNRQVLLNPRHVADLHSSTHVAREHLGWHQWVTWRHHVQCIRHSTVYIYTASSQPSGVHTANTWHWGYRLVSRQRLTFIEHFRYGKCYFQTHIAKKHLKLAVDRFKCASAYISRL